jgi:protein-disulfide isomerase
MITQGVRQLALGALLVAFTCGANAAVSVVKVINFSCQFCKSSEAMDTPIRTSVELAGGKLVYAVMPADENSDGSRERMYYAARAKWPALEPRVRDALYRGAQDLGYPLATANQTAEWLSTDLADLNYDWVSLVQSSATGEPNAAFQRALRLAVQAGVQVLPAYVVVQDGQVLQTLDVDSAGGTYSGLRQAVINAVNKANVSSTPTPQISQ